jgi:hypothetical protein
VSIWISQLGNSSGYRLITVIRVGVDLDLTAGQLVWLSEIRVIRVGVDLDQFGCQ